MHAESGARSKWYEGKCCELGLTSHEPANDAARPLARRKMRSVQIVANINEVVPVGREHPRQSFASGDEEQRSCEWRAWAESSRRSSP
jgi:hypothetical protein